MARQKLATAGLARLTPDFYLALGRAIKVVRTELGMERKELARLSNLSYPYLSEIEQGKKRLSSESLRAIARALRLRQSELLERAERSLDRDQVMAALPAAVSRRARPSRRSTYGRLYRIDPAASLSVTEEELHELASRAAQLGADDFHRVLDLVRRLTR
jgi:transcriptional regulator with XRE-family HTH domain